jgi:hypothetical protein
MGTSTATEVVLHGNMPPKWTYSIHATEVATQNQAAQILLTNIEAKLNN